MTTEYHYGGKGDPLKQRRKLRFVTCATLAVMVLSQMTSAFAWGHHRHYFYRMPDGTVWSTRHRYGWGDWDDFAMYLGRFGIIPVKDRQVRTLQKDVRSIAEAIRELAASRKEEAIQQQKQDKFNQTGRDGKSDKWKEMSASAGKMVDTVSDSMATKNSVVNPNKRMMEGVDTRYTNKELTEGIHGKVMQDHEKYLDQTYQEARSVYDVGLRELAKVSAMLKEIGRSDNGQGQNTEGYVSAANRKQVLLKLRIALGKQKEEIDGVAERTQAANERAANDELAIYNSHVRAQNHMPTKQEYKTQVKEKEKELSTSHDLGYIKFGKNNKKADFSKILPSVLSGHDEKKD